jgi:hypothetical protein
MGLFGGGDTAPEYHAPEPWKAQGPYLKSGFSEAQRLYDLFQGSPSYQGNLYSPMNPLQQGGAWQLANYGAGQGQDLGNAAGQASMSNLGAGQQFGQNALDIYGRSQQDPTQQIVGNAGTFADNPYMSGMIDAASRDVVRNLNENDLPQLNQDANMSGNTDSSRTGIAQGILQRGAADRVGDIASNLRGGAYANGLSLAAGNYQNGIQNQLNANSQAGNAFSTGVQGAQGAFGLGTGAAGAIGQAGGAFQNDEQQMLNEAYNRWNMQDQRPSDLLNRYWGVASTGFGGGSGGYAPAGSGGMGFAQGAIGGATAGAAFGPWGAAAGGALGGLSTMM